MNSIEIKLSDAEMERFKKGHEKCGLHDNVNGLIGLAAQVGLASLERIKFDIGDAINTASRRPGRKGGAA